MVSSWFHLSPSLSALNCLASRQDSSGPTLPPGRAGSEIAPTHISMFCGVPYRSCSLWANVKFPRSSARSDVVLGTERLQDFLHEPYPGGTGSEGRALNTGVQAVTKTTWTKSQNNLKNFRYQLLGLKTKHCSIAKSIYLKGRFTQIFQRYRIFPLPFDLFINLDCLGVSCLMQMSAFTPI